MKIYSADFETEAFDFSKEANYQIKSRFICFTEIFTNEQLFFNIEKNGSKKLAEFIYSLCSIKNPCRIYFHNLKFDLAFLYESLPKNFYYKIIMSGSKIISFKVFREYKRLKKDGSFRIEKKTFLDIRDSLVLFVSSLSKLGKAIGIKKLEQDYFSEIIDNKYIQYCYRDTEIVQKTLFLLVDFLKEYFNYDLNLVKIPLTISSLSKRLFHFVIQDKFNKNILAKIYHYTAKKFESDLRDYYFGGRVEVLDFNPCINGHYNDINSLYPSIMKEEAFPIPPYSRKQLNDYIDINSSKGKSLFNDNKAFGFLCEINETFDIPLLPTRIKSKSKQEKIIFGKGKKVHFLFRKEIKYLKKHDIDIKIKDIYYCSEYLYIFNYFISILYEIKKSNLPDSFIYYFCKILMNALYGKFAEKMEKELIEIINEIDVSIPLEQQHLQFTDYDFFIKREVEIHDKIKINIVFSMMITALARLKIYKYTIKTKKVHYIDTDSNVSQELIENSKQIGKMNSEFEFDKFQALGCKEYVINEWKLQKNPIINVPILITRVKMKGFGKITSNSLETFITSYFDGKKQNRLIGFLESFVRDLPLNTMLVFNKFKTSIYDKRWILDDFTTKAFHLQNDDFNEMIKNNEKQIIKLIKKNEI